jgi:hypothetical protein
MVALPRRKGKAIYALAADISFREALLSSYVDRRRQRLESQVGVLE